MPSVGKEYITTASPQDIATDQTAGLPEDLQKRVVAAVDEHDAKVYRRLRDVRDHYRDEIRARYPSIPRRVSGYNLDSLLHEGGLDAAGLLIGSEGTLATVLHAELRLVPTVARTAMVVLGYDDIAAAADAVPALLSNCDPLQLEADGADHARCGRVAW